MAKDRLLEQLQEENPEVTGYILLQITDNGSSSVVVEMSAFEAVAALEMLKHSLLHENDNMRLN